MLSLRTGLMCVMEQTSVTRLHCCIYSVAYLDLICGICDVRAGITEQVLCFGCMKRAVMSHPLENQALSTESCCVLFATILAW